MSDTGYFSQIGQRVAAMSAPPAPQPQVERLTLDAPTETEAAPALNEVPPNPQIPKPLPAKAQADILRAPALQAPAQMETQPQTEDQATPQARAQEPAEIRQVADPVKTPSAQEMAPPRPVPTEEARAFVPEMAKPSQPSPEAPDLPAQNPVKAPKVGPAQPEPAQTAPDIAESEMSTEDHIALFEHYIDALNGQDTPQPVPPPDITPQQKPQAAAPSAPAPRPQSPTLEIGEITVEVLAAKPAPASRPYASAPIRTPPRTMPSHGRRSGLRPM